MQVTETDNIFLDFVDLDFVKYKMEKEFYNPQS